MKNFHKTGPKINIESEASRLDDDNKNKSKT